MWSGARRLLSRGGALTVRRALLMFCAAPGALAAAPLITSAAYEEPTTRYAHAVLGDAVEHITLALTLTGGVVQRFRLPDDLVFEDTAPRVVDLDGDGIPEVIAVESSQTEGARLTIYGVDGRIAATPFIGTRFRWLAPVGAADLDGDGQVEIAFVDRPHLAKTLRIMRYAGGQLVPVTARAGLTNHRIGERDIAGGIRDCGQGPEMILATGNWSELVALRLTDGQVTARAIGTDTSRAGFARALACPS